MLSNPGEQRALLMLLDDRPELGVALGVVMGKPFTDMSKQEKLIALRQYQTSGMALAPVGRVAKLARELIEESRLINEDEVEILARKLKKSKRKIKKLRAELAATQARLDPPPEGSP